MICLRLAVSVHHEICQMYLQTVSSTKCHVWCAICAPLCASQQLVVLLQSLQSNQKDMYGLDYSGTGQGREVIDTSSVLAFQKKISNHLGLWRCCVLSVFKPHSEILSVTMNLQLPCSGLPQTQLQRE